MTLILNVKTCCRCGSFCGQWQLLIRAQSQQTATENPYPDLKHDSREDTTEAPI